jgi:hypothetical protein
MGTIMKNLIPVTLGNAFAGAVIIGCGFSYLYGSLGKGKQARALDAALRSGRLVELTSRVAGALARGADVVLRRTYIIPDGRLAPPAARETYPPLCEN